MKIELTKTQVVNEEKAVPKKLRPFIAILIIDTSETVDVEGDVNKVVKELS